MAGHSDIKHHTARYPDALGELQHHDLVADIMRRWRAPSSAGAQTYQATG
jgi:hypothetical protein